MNNNNNNNNSTGTSTTTTTGNPFSSSSSSFPAATDTNYHSTLLLLGSRNQAPPDFWGHREVLEAPSTRDAHSRRRTFSCCGSLHMQVGLDRESRALRERRKRHDARRIDGQWLHEYGTALSRTTEELADIQQELRLAARLQNTVLEHQGVKSNSSSSRSGGGSDLQDEELDPILIRFEDGPRSPAAGRVVNLGILRRELDAALAGVTANRRNKKTTGSGGGPTKPTPPSRLPVAQDSRNSSVPAPIASKPIAHARPRRYSALIPGSFKSYMAWPGGGGGGGEKVDTPPENPPLELQELLQTNPPREKDAGYSRFSGLARTGAHSNEATEAR